MIIDMRKKRSICDYFVIAGGTSTTQVRAIADHIMRTMKDAGQRLWHAEGISEALWILLDYSEIVAHVFTEETRHFYQLEKLWGDAPRVKPKEERPRKKPAVKPRKRRKRSR